MFRLFSLNLQKKEDSKMKKKVLNIEMKLAIVLLLFVFATPAFGAAPGIHKGKIVIGAFLPLQSGFAAGATQYRDGAEAYLKYVNDTGGVHGRKVYRIVENDSYNPQQALAVAKKLVDRDGVFAIVSTIGTSTNLASLPFLAQRGVPFINPAGGHNRLNRPTDNIIFAWVPPGIINGIDMANYALDKLGSKKIGIYFQNDQFGKDPRDGVIQALKKRGMEPVAEASYIPSDVDVSAQAVTLMKAGADIVIMACIPKHGSLLLMEAQKLDWKPKFLGMNTMADPITVKLAGTAINGMYINFFTAVETMENKALKKANEILKKYYPDTRPGYWSYLGMSGAIVFVEGAKRAGKDLTREKLISSLETLKDFETGVVPPLTFGPGNHGNADKFGYAIWEDGKIKVIRGW